MKALLYGIYPRSDDLRKEINRWERFGQKEDLKKAFRSETLSLESTFDSYALTYTDPLFNWNDILRPVALSMEHVKLGELRRYMETNTFYRQPVIDHYPSFSEVEKDPYPYFPLYYGESSLAFLPSISTFLSMSSVNKNLDRKKLFGSIFDVYTDILSKYGKSSVLLFGVDPVDQDEIQYVEMLSDTCSVTVISPRKVNKTPFLKITDKIEGVASVDSLDILPNSRCPVYIEVIDSKNTRVEDPEYVRDIVSKAESSGNLAGITASDYLDFLPRVIADRKAKVMSEVINGE